MSADDIQIRIFIATLFVLGLRWFVGVAYPWRQHRIWTFGLSLSGWIALYLRLIVTRVDLISPLDPISTAIWLYILATQVIAVGYVWANRRRR